jgi:Flp pilus assembly protein TadG
MRYLSARTALESTAPSAGADRRRARRRATNVVEFAVIAPIYLMIVLGIIELGRGLMVTMLLFNGARIGARVGTLEGKSTTDIKGAVNDYLSSMGISGDAVTVDVNDNVTDAMNAQQGDEITVIASISASKVTWVPGVQLVGFLSNGTDRDFTLQGEFTLRRE